jgi:hypothetical protein
MVYVEDWQDFVGLAEELYRAAPLQVRACAVALLPWAAHGTHTGLRFCCLLFSQGLI